MLRRASIDADLLNVDGSCRDIGFDRATWTGLRDLVAGTLLPFPKLALRGEDSHDLDHALIPDALAAIQTIQTRGGYLQIVLDGGTSLLAHLQVSAHSTHGEDPSVDLTFFPQDVLVRPSPEAQFLLWADAVAVTLGAGRYFVRYENASWTFGDQSAQSGVILVRSLTPREGDLETTA